MRATVMNDMVRIANECRGPLCAIAKSAISKGVVDADTLMASLEKAGFEVCIDGSKKPNRVQVEVFKMVTLPEDIDLDPEAEPARMLVAKGASDSASEALLHAILAEMRVEKLHFCN